MAVAVQTGKDKVMRWARIFVNEFDLSCDARTFTTLDNNFDEADITGWCEPVSNFIAASPRHVGVRGFQALLNDAAAASLTHLKTASQSARLSVIFGGGKEPTVGDPAYLITAIEMGNLAGWDGMAASIGTDLLPDSSQYLAGAGNPLGHVLSGAVSLAATTTGLSHDNGASTLNGGHANLHVNVSSGGTWLFKVQHSPDDAAWADLLTFTLNGSVVGSEQKAAASGLVDRYTRLLATRTSGTVTPIVTFARN